MQVTRTTEVRNDRWYDEKEGLHRKLRKHKVQRFERSIRRRFIGVAVDASVPHRKVANPLASPHDHLLLGQLVQRLVEYVAIQCLKRHWFRKQCRFFVANPTLSVCLRAMNRFFAETFTPFVLSRWPAIASATWS